MTAPVHRGRLLATLLTAGAQLAVLLGAAILGILIARRFSTGPATDGFFTANAIYGIALFVGQSLRTTAVTGLLGGRDAYRAHLRAVALLALLAGAAFAVAGWLVLPAALEPAATETARRALLILWPAAALQLAGGLTAAMLATLDDYRAAALAYGAGAATSVAVFAALAGPVGIEAVPIALAAGSAVSTGWMLLALRRRGAPAGGAAPPAPTLAARLLLGAVALVAAQIVLSASIAFAAAADGEGAATVFSYAQMAIAVLSATLISPVTVVFAPVVAREAGAGLLDLAERALRAGAMALPPAVAAVVLLGPDPAEWLLTGFTRAEVDELFDLVLLLSPSLIAAQLVMIPLLGVLTAHRFGPLAAGSLAVAALHLVLCTVAGESSRAIAVISDVSSFGLAAVAVVLAFGAEAGAFAARAARAYATIALPGAVAFAAAAAVLPAAAAFVAGLAVHAAWLALAHRAEVGALIPRVRP